MKEKCMTYYEVRSNNGAVICRCYSRKNAIAEADRMGPASVYRVSISETEILKTRGQVRCA